jgi:hypothetical protein
MVSSLRKGEDDVTSCITVFIVPCVAHLYRSNSAEHRDVKRREHKESAERRRDIFAFLCEILGVLCG